MDECETGTCTEEQAFGSVERKLKDSIRAEVPVAIHAERLVGVYTRGGVIEVAHCQFVLRVSELGTHSL